MKKIIFIAIFLIPAIILVFCSGSVSGIKNENRQLTSLNKNNIVVMELFTSQGCSSCPPADRLLGSYANREDIAALSFHVDYWNRLGWKDPFSDQLYSERQHNYAASFGSGSVYTPQLIINGEKEMVGSDEDKIASTIKQLQKPSSSQINIEEIKNSGNSISINYSVTGKRNNSVVNIALVQNKITTSIKAGENEGVTLTNYNVVRNFKKVSSISEGKNTAVIDITTGINKKDCSLILFLQDMSTNKVFAAVKAGL